MSAIAGLSEADRQTHIRFFMMHMKTIPEVYLSLDPQRMTLAYFCVAALDLLGALDKVDGPAICDWVYAQQVLPAPPGARPSAAAAKSGSAGPGAGAGAGAVASAGVGVGAGAGAGVGAGDSASASVGEAGAAGDESGLAAALASSATLADGAAAAVGTVAATVAESGATDPIMAALNDVDGDGSEFARCGFHGSPFLGRPHASTPEAARAAAAASRVSPATDRGHIASTYTALCLLLMLGDDLSRLDRAAIARGLRSLQKPSGAFMATSFEPKDDMRFLFCACAVSYMLGDWSGVDRDAATAFVRRCQQYDGGFGLAEDLEAHGGSTYTAVASLWLMGRLHPPATAATTTAATTAATAAAVPSGVPRPDDLVRWCVERQVGGFQGRPNKPEDTCYSFWIGGTLAMLGRYDFVRPDELVTFIMTCANARFGGFCKEPRSMPDVLHSYFSLCGLSMAGHDPSELRTVHVPLGISMRAATAAGLVGDFVSVPLGAGLGRSVETDEAAEADAGAGAGAGDAAVAPEAVELETDGGSAAAVSSVLAVGTGGTDIGIVA